MEQSVIISYYTESGTWLYYCSNPQSHCLLVFFYINLNLSSVALLKASKPLNTVTIASTLKEWNISKAHHNKDDTLTSLPD